MYGTKQVDPLPYCAVRRTAPMTPAERAAAYRKRHPDRVAAYNARRRVANRGIRAEEILRREAAVRAEAEQSLPALPPAPVQLCLPAAATEPLFVFTIDERLKVAA